MKEILKHVFYLLAGIVLLACSLFYYQKIEEYYDTYNTGIDIEKAILFNSMGQCYYSFPDTDTATLYFEKSSK